MICKFPKDYKFENLKYLYEGAFRVAYVFGKNRECVVKFSHNNELNKHNLTEARLWKEMPDKLRKYFVPVTDYDKKGEWLIMPRVKSIELSDNHREIIRKVIHRKMIDNRFFCNDIHLYNIGLNEDKPVILDYGFDCDFDTSRKNTYGKFSDMYKNFW